MNLEVLGNNRHPEVALVPTYEGGSFIVPVSIGKLSLSVSAKKILITSVTPSDLPALRNGNSYVIRDYVTEVKDRVGSYSLHRSGEISVTYESQRTKKYEVFDFMEVAPVDPATIDGLRPSLDLSSPRNKDALRSFLSGEISPEEAGPSFYHTVKGTKAVKLGRSLPLPKN